MILRRGVRIEPRVTRHDPIGLRVCEPLQSMRRTVAKTLIVNEKVQEKQENVDAIMSDIATKFGVIAKTCK